MARSMPMRSSQRPTRCATKRLEQDGWTLLRFWNDDILRDIDNVCQHIVIAAGLAGGAAGNSAGATWELRQ